MKYCQQCGNQLEDNAVYCPYCGTKSEVNTPNQQPENNNFNGYNNAFNNAPQQNYNQYNQQNNYKPTQDAPSVAGFACLAFCFPIVGIILYCVWQKDRPKNAKTVLTAAVVSFLLGIVFYIFSFILGIATADYGAGY